jgi:hypothetical protein
MGEQPDVERGSFRDGTAVDANVDVDVVRVKVLM